MQNFTVHFEQYIHYNGQALDHHRTEPVLGVASGEEAIAMVQNYLRRQLVKRAKGGTVPALESMYHDFTAKVRAERSRKQETDR
jgi:hypothetical protein